MNIDVENKGDISICRLSGEVTFSTSPDLRKKLLELIDKKAKNIVLNMKKVSYIDSSGMATLVELLQKMKKENGSLKLVEVQAKVKDILEMVRLKDIFQIYENEEEALASC